MNGAMAIFSSPTICSFGLTGSLSFTSRTPAVAVSGMQSAAMTARGRFMDGLREGFSGGRRGSDVPCRGERAPAARSPSEEWWPARCPWAARSIPERCLMCRRARGHPHRGGGVAGVARRRTGLSVQSAAHLALLPLLVARRELDETAVVLLDVLIRFVEAHRLAILLRRVLEVSVGLVRDGEVVVRHGVTGTHLHRALETEQRLAPEVHPGHVDAEVLLRGPRVVPGARAGSGHHRDQQQTGNRRRALHERGLLDLVRQGAAIILVATHLACGSAALCTHTQCKAKIAIF